MSDNNFYFETLRRTEGELTDDVISQRIAECNMVLGELTKSAVWNILLSDAKQMIKRIDDSWQDIVPDSKQFQEARVLKMASKHIFDLPMKYAQELDMLQTELQKRQQPDEVIQKDNDNE
jgi:hypothetical protein